LTSQVYRDSGGSIDLILHQIKAVAKRAPKNSEIFITTIPSPTLENLLVIDVAFFNELAVGIHGNVTERQRSAVVRPAA
jgi:hypothetical protein